MNRGVLPSPPDQRDYRIGAAMDVSADALPPEIYVWQPPVENQGSTGNCVAQTLANIIECACHRKTGKHLDYSVGAIYGTQSGWGMNPRQALDAVVKQGDVLRATWEYLGENPGCYNAWQAVKDSFADDFYKALLYVRLETIDEIKLWMKKTGLPVFLSCPAPVFGERHAVTGCGVKDDKIKFTNSWGVTYGDQGTGWLTMADVEEVWGVDFMADTIFKDVDDTRWSATAITEAAADGIIKGFEDGTFRPTEPLTREQFAVLWQRMKTKLNP